MKVYCETSTLTVKCMHAWLLLCCILNRLPYRSSIAMSILPTMSEYRDLPLKNISLRFWTKLEECLNDTEDVGNVAVALSRDAGDKCHEYRSDEIEGFKQDPDPVKCVLLAWADKKKATVADLEGFFGRNRDFGSQPLELLQSYCGEY